MNICYSESKTDLKLHCDYCIKFQLFEGAQDVIGRFDGCVLHAANLKPTQITPALQEVHLWALL
jgi:hypothetical protein